MKIFWTPWRSKYIDDSLNVKNSDCVFCDIMGQTPELANLIVYSEKEVFAVLNKYPYNNGHVLVIPKFHVDDLSKLGNEQYQSLTLLLRRTINVIKHAYKPHGVNVGLNLGRSAGAGIESHVHFHVVPRWNGDTNFMPVFSETKIISEDISVTYDKIANAFQEVEE